MCQISARLKYARASYSDLCKVCEMAKKKKKKTKKFLRNFADSYLGNGFRNLPQIGNAASPASTVNLKPFGEDNTELRMHENCKFVIPFSILTPFV